MSRKPKPKPCPRCGGTRIVPVDFWAKEPETHFIGGVCSGCGYLHIGHVNHEVQKGEALEVWGGRPEKA